MKPLPIRRVKAIAEELGAEGVAVFIFKDSNVAGTSYGADKDLCRRMGKFIDRMVDDLGDGKIDNPLDDGACPWPILLQE